MPNGALLLVRLALCALASALLVWVGEQVHRAGALIGFVMSIPLYGVALAKPMLELVEEGVTWLVRQPLRQWDGRYYEFDGVQVRVYEDDDKLWFVAKDVVSATRSPEIPNAFLVTHAAGCRVLDGTRLKCLDLDTLEQLLGRSRENDANRFILWARREVEMPWERKRAP